MLDYDDDDNELSPIESFRAGWADMMAGRVHPLSDLLRELNYDDDEHITEAERATLYERYTRLYNVNLDAPRPDNDSD